MRYFLPYFVARHAAVSLDRQDARPGMVLLVLTGIASAAALGLLATVAFVLAWTGLAAAGVVT